MIKLKEVNLEQIQVLEETDAPAFGVFCGGGCWGVACAF